VAFSITYRRLFELRFLPGFALDAPDGTAFFDRSAGDQEAALGNFNLSDWISIIPTQETQRRMAGLKIKTSQTANSFFAGIEVTEEDNGGNPAYRPAVPPVDGTGFRFLLKIKNPLLANITNLPWRSSHPAKLFLSNRTATNYPSLAEDIPSYAAGLDYSMSELVEQGSNIYEALQDIQDAAVTPGTDPAVWAQINDHQYAGRADLKLIPGRFSYSLPSSASETDISWELVAAGPTTVASGNETGANPIPMISIDLGESPAGSYTLNITGTNGFAASHQVEYEPELFGYDVFGLVELVHEAGLGDFRLMENDGRLRIDGGLSTTPVFDIRLRRRSIFYRYFFIPDLAPATPLGDLQAEIDNRYISQNPVPLIHEPVNLSYDGGTLLPSARPDLLKNEANRVFAELYVYI
jgi:hypothetical protein